MTVIDGRFLGVAPHEKIKIEAENGRTFLLIQEEDSRRWSIGTHGGRIMRRLALYDLGTVMWLFPDGVMYAHTREILSVSGVSVPPDVLIKVARYMRPGHPYRIAGDEQYRLMRLGSLFNNYRTARAARMLCDELCRKVPRSQQRTTGNEERTAALDEAARSALQDAGFNEEELELIYSLGQTGVTHPASVMEAIEAFRGIG